MLRPLYCVENGPRKNILRPGRGITEEDED